MVREIRANGRIEKFILNTQRAQNQQTNIRMNHSSRVGRVCTGPGENIRAPARTPFYSPPSYALEQKCPLENATKVKIPGLFLIPRPTKASNFTTDVERL